MPAPPLCPGDLPLVLLPVRLETRFFTLADGSTELRVRVFPDKIHLDSHEPDLTADEQTWGQHYWEQNWRPATTRRGAAADAWRQIADRFGAGRAAWIVRVLDADQCVRAADVRDAGRNRADAAPLCSRRSSLAQQRRGVASRAAGATDARSLGRGRAFRRARRGDGHRQRHPATARGRSGSAGAATPMPRPKRPSRAASSSRSTPA